LHGNEHHIPLLLQIALVRMGNAQLAMHQL